MKFWLWISCICLPLGSIAQLQLQGSFEIAGDHINIASEGTVWTWSSYVVETYTPEGELQLSNSLQYYGAIGNIDLRNPLKPLAFFPDQNQITFLDNKVAARGDQIALDIAGYPMVGAACASYNNGYWIYDGLSQKLVRFDANGQVTHETAYLPQLIGNSSQITQLIEGKDRLYALTDRGIARFDLFGAYQNSIPYEGVLEMVYYENQLWFLSESHIVVLDRIGTWIEYDLPKSEVVDFGIFGKRLYLLHQKVVEIYTFAD